jgi:hypothetical protein
LRSDFSCFLTALPASARLDGFPAGHFLFIAVAVAPTLPPASRKRIDRRNISEIDRIMLASKREEIVARKAKASYKENVGRPSKSSPKLATISKVDTRAECAKAAGVGERNRQSHQTPLPRIASRPPACFDLIRGWTPRATRATRETKTGSRLSLSINLNGFCFTLLHLDENSQNH